MKSKWLRFGLITLLVISTTAILYARLWLREVPTQIAPRTTYILLAINLIVVGLLALRPSALGLATRTRRS